MFYYVYLRKASDFGWEEKHKVKKYMLDKFLLKQIERFGCHTFQLMFDPMYEDEFDEVSIYIRDTWME